MDNLKLAELLFKDLDLTVADIEKKYPPRELPAGAMVTRIAHRGYRRKTRSPRRD